MHKETRTMADGHDVKKSRQAPRVSVESCRRRRAIEKPRLSVYPVAFLVDIQEGRTLKDRTSEV
jgi:hypothetical protein